MTKKSKTHLPFKTKMQERRIGKDRPKPAPHAAR
jgi:hypothetical protein